jgi:hypothetical protein
MQHQETGNAPDQRCPKSERILFKKERDVANWSMQEKEKRREEKKKCETCMVTFLSST